MSGPLLAGRRLQKAFGPTTALRGVDIDVFAGEVLAIMGPSGSGKSTLLHCLAGILTPDAGVVHFDGRRIDDLGDNQRSRLRRSTFGFVFQFGQLVPELPALENIALPLLLVVADVHVDWEPLRGPVGPPEIVLHPSVLQDLAGHRLAGDRSPRSDLVGHARERHPKRYRGAPLVLVPIRRAGCQFRRGAAGRRPRALPAPEDSSTALVRARSASRRSRSAIARSSLSSRSSRTRTLVHR